MMVRRYAESDRAEWYRMRHALWPEHTFEEFEVESIELLACADVAVIIAEADGRPVGLAEVSIHTEAPGCATNRVGFLETWYVDPAYRRRGIGHALVLAAED